MGLFRTVKVNQILNEGLPGLQPLEDKVFQYLFGQAMTGDLQVFWAAIPMGLIIPFDKEYNPSLHPVGAAAIEEVTKEWQKGQFRYCWVYPQNKKFVLSDDYIIYFAALNGKPDYLPCFVMGDPHEDGVVDIQGPMSPESLREYAGFPPK